MIGQGSLDQIIDEEIIGRKKSIQRFKTLYVKKRSERQKNYSQPACRAEVMPTDH